MQGMDVRAMASGRTWRSALRPRRAETGALAPARATLLDVSASSSQSPPSVPLSQLPLVRPAPP
eukprot:6603383-Pyramimonas_sp.AAC.1